MRFEELLGMTFTNVTGKVNEDEMHFHSIDGRHFKLHHNQGCCESVYIESIVGDLKDLIGAPILQAEEVENNSDLDPDGNKLPTNKYDESYTWTFYKLATLKGYVTIRWYGSSNGYYSESVDFKEVQA